MLWDRETLGSPRRAIVWQDRRTAGLCDELREDGHEPRVTERLTGLRLDPYFSATKLAWMRTNDPDTWAASRPAEVAVGTVDSYLVARMTRGLHHVTDASNASRTLLYDLHTGDVDARAARAVRRPAVDALPEVVAVVRRHRPHRPRRASSASTCRSPAIAGDQQAALFGQALLQRRVQQVHLRHRLLRPGQHRRPRSWRRTRGLLTTVALAHPDGRRDVRPRGGGLRHGRRGPVAARRAADHRRRPPRPRRSPGGPRLRRASSSSRP